MSISLPFHQGLRSDWFPELHLSFPLWRHQELAFQHLNSGSPGRILLLTGKGPVGWRLTEHQPLIL